MQVSVGIFTYAVRGGVQHRDRPRLSHLVEIPSLAASPPLSCLDSLPLSLEASLSSPSPYRALALPLTEVPRYHRRTLWYVRVRHYAPPSHSYNSAIQTP